MAEQDHITDILREIGERSYAFDANHIALAREVTRLRRWFAFRQAHEKAGKTWEPMITIPPLLHEPGNPNYLLWWWDAALQGSEVPQ